MRRLPPVLLIGAEISPAKVTLKGGAERHRVSDVSAASALDCELLTVPPDALHPAMPIPRPGASRSIILAVLRGIVAVPSLIVLAGCLAGYAETVGYVWPADAQSHGLVDEAC
jgi:hypothetical protein